MEGANNQDLPYRLPTYVHRNCFVERGLDLLHHFPSCSLSLSLFQSRHYPCNSRFSCSQDPAKPEKKATPILSLTYDWIYPVVPTGGSPNPGAEAIEPPRFFVHLE